MHSTARVPMFIIEHYSSFGPSYVDDVCKSRYTYDDYERVLFILELIMLRSGTIDADLSAHDASFIHKMCSLIYI